MKTQILSLILMALPSMSLAKAVDFNALITENAQQQQELYKSITTQTELAREAQKTDEAYETAYTDGNSDTINVPTNKDILSFDKEKSFYKATGKKQLERLATEFESVH